MGLSSAFQKSPRRTAAYVLCDSIRQSSCAVASTRGRGASGCAIMLSRAERAVGEVKSSMGTEPRGAGGSMLACPASTRFADNVGTP